MPADNAEIEQMKSELKQLREEIATMQQRGVKRAHADSEVVQRRIGSSPLVSAFTAFSLGFLSGRFLSR